MGPLTTTASIKTRYTKYLQWEHKASVSNVDKMCWPTLSRPALWGLTATVNVSQAFASVADLTNALVCRMEVNPCNQEVPNSYGKISRNVGAAIDA